MSWLPPHLPSVFCSIRNIRLEKLWSLPDDTREHAREWTHSNSAPEDTHLSKQISSAELAEIVKNLLTDTESTGELDSPSTFACFMTEIAEVVCKFCGGEVKNQADQFTGDWLVGVHGNDSLPEGGGIWAGYDPDGELDA